jgi:hypothetical protein
MLKAPEPLLNEDKNALSGEDVKDRLSNEQDSLQDTQMFRITPLVCENSGNSTAKVKMVSKRPRSCQSIDIQETSNKLS